nr:hypothetical protein [Veillonella atypica]
MMYANTITKLHQAFEFRSEYVEKLKDGKNELPQEVLDVLKTLMYKHKDKVKTARHK